MPHTVTGFSPFQLIYDSNVCGPPNVLRDVRIDGDVPEYNLLEWVAHLKCNLADFLFIAGDKTALVKCTMKSNILVHISFSSLVTWFWLSSKFSDTS